MDKTTMKTVLYRFFFGVSGLQIEEKKQKIQFKSLLVV